MFHTNIIRYYENIYSLTNLGHSVLDLDCVKYGVDKIQRRSLVRILRSIAKEIKQGFSINDYIEMGFLKKLVRDVGDQNNVWEVRDEGHHCRLIFLIDKKKIIILSVANKLNQNLSQAIKRGLKRWKKFQNPQRV